MSDELTALIRRIIGFVFQVNNASGSGFLEMAYGNALTIEPRKNDIYVMQQRFDFC